MNKLNESFIFVSMKFILQTFFKGLYYFIVDKTFRNFVYLCIRYGSSKRYQERNIKINGIKFKVPDAKSFIWQYYEIFFKKYYLFNSSKNTPVIIDCGSNVGLSVYFFKKQYPNSHIHCFEADNSIFKILEYNIRAASLDNISSYNQAVWTKNELLNFASEGADGGKITNKSASNTNSVNGIDFSEFLDKFEHIDFLKIDIEGAEHMLLPHISKHFNKIDFIFIEYHSFYGENQNFDSIIKEITSSGHRIYIDNVTFKNQPFIINEKKSNMDLQLNIFAYKI